MHERHEARVGLARQRSRALFKMPHPARSARISLLLLFLVACAGSPRGSGTPPPAPVQHREVTVDGLVRRYRVFAPSTLPPRRRAPLVVVLHGEGNTADSMVETTQFDREAATGNFIVAYPEGIERSWNGGFCCGRSLRNQVDDVGFLNHVLDDLLARYRIDRTRVYVTGVSSGAIMAYRFGCEASERVSGVGSVAGAMVLEACNPSKPVSVIEIHGTEDPLVPYAGGTVEPEGVASQPAPPALALVERWAALDGCTHPPVVEERPPVSVSIWGNCSSGTQVRLVAIEGGGHTWFARGLGVTAGAVDATEVIWKFFSRVRARS